jgi:hypothetical protein
MKNLKQVIILISILAIMSCSNDNDGGSIQFELKAVNTASKSTVQKIGNAIVIFTDFRISIRDVVFKNEDDPNSSLDTDEIQFRGPYQIDLLNGVDVITQTIGEAFVPDGLYKELRFKFHKDENLPVTDKLYDRSIYIEGTIDGKPFTFWHDTSENLDMGRTTGVSVQNGSVNFTVQFDISQFLSSLHQIDLSQANDANDNGMIEIFPNDQDGNQEIAKDLKDNIKATADLINL